MNYTEQKNYIIAVFVSLIFHFFILTIYLSGIMASKKLAIEETFPVSLVEIASGNNSRRISVALNTPKKGQSHKVAVSDTTMEKLENQSAPRENTETKSAPKPGQPPKDAAMLPEKEKVAASDTPIEKPGNENASSVNTRETTGSGNSDFGELKSFGTGEAMVKIVGPMPTYPPAVFKEGKEGEVAVRILVNADGQLDLVIITKTSGDIRLDYAATSSIERNWKFTSINEGYYIDLTFSFDIHIGASVKFLASKTRS